VAANFFRQMAKWRHSRVAQELGGEKLSALAELNYTARKSYLQIF